MTDAFNLQKKEWYAVTAQTVVICLLEEFLISKLLSLEVGIIMCKTDETQIIYVRK